MDAFVHRTGRTGRAGKQGLNIVFAERDTVDFLKQLEDNLNIKLNYLNDIGSSISDDSTTTDSDSNEIELQK